MESKKVEETILESEKRFRQFSEISFEGIIIHDYGTIVDANNTIANMLGYELNEIIGKTVLDFAAEESHDLIMKNIGYEKPYELVALRKNGSKFPIEVIAKNVIYKGKSLRVTAIRDITDRIKAEEDLRKAHEELEKRVEERTFELSEINNMLIQEIRERKAIEKILEIQKEELERSNQELEHFAYVASHDLQEPLRMISSYLQLLQKRYIGKLDQDADDFIEFAVSGAKRMQGMLQGLLDYSRIGRKGNSLTETDLNQVIEIAISNLLLSINESGAKILYNTLPTVLADMNQMIRLFQNLINNSIKYKGNENPVILISSQLDDKKWIIKIKDNGIGIDKSNFKRIFTIFQRLHSKSEYPGEGLGLAVCKKIIERHGGKIWVESEPGDGTTFFITIPV